MGILRSNPRVEHWLTKSGCNWSYISETDYKFIVKCWNQDYADGIEREKPLQKGERALALVNAFLPKRVVLFSGIKIRKIGNLGGAGATGFSVSDLKELDLSILRSNEMIVCEFNDSKLKWCLLTSHETGSLFHEELFGEQPIPA